MYDQPLAPTFELTEAIPPPMMPLKAPLLTWNHRPADPQVAEPWTIRTYQSDDQPHIMRLYEEGMLGPEPRQAEPPRDLYDVPANYLSDPRNHLWVADLRGRVVGMIAVDHVGPRVAVVRRLRIDADAFPAMQPAPLFTRESVASSLLARVLAHCRRHAFLKVVLDTHYPSESTHLLLAAFGFMHNRSRPSHGREVHEFYLNLYSRPDRRPRWARPSR